MSNLSPKLPDAMPLREALRGLRHVLRKGGETLKNTMTVDTLPRPAARLAGVLLREVEALAKGMDHAASGLAKKMLGTADIAAPSLHRIASQHDSAAVFAQAFYTAAQAVLKQLGVTDIFISEAHARKAYQAATARDATDADRAATVMLALLDAGVLKGTPDHTARLPLASVEPVACFAVLLWLQSQRPEVEDEAALTSATELSVALVSDITAACKTRNAATLAALFSEFSAHV